jgi:hypothetical protein
MKKTLLFLFAVLLTFGSCSNDDEQVNVLHATTWTQDIRDKSHWFIFLNQGDSPDKGDVSYVETELGDDLSFYISKYLGKYEIDKNNEIKIYIITDEIDPNTGYPKVHMLFTGHLKDGKIYLEGDGISGEEQAFELTKYTRPKQ